MSALTRFNAWLRDTWAGYKTNIVLVLQGLALILATREMQIDPQAIIDWIESVGLWVQGGVALVTAAGVWFRQMGKQRERNSQITANSLLGELNRADDKVREMEKSVPAKAKKRHPTVRKTKKKPARR